MNAQSRPEEQMNVGEFERNGSLAAGAMLVACGLLRPLRISSVLIIGIGAGMVYRGLTGHCHVYDALGLNTRHTAQEAEAPTPREYAPKNRLDKDRFDKLRATQVDRGRDPAEATEVAAEEVKELRRREGRSKETELSEPEEFEKTRDRRHT